MSCLLSGKAKVMRTELLQILEEGNVSQQRNFFKSELSTWSSVHLNSGSMINRQDRVKGESKVRRSEPLGRRVNFCKPLKGFLKANLFIYVARSFS